MIEEGMMRLFDEVNETDLKITDENEKLCIWNYTGNDKSKYNLLRGYITERESKNTVCPSLGHTEEFTVDESERCKAFLNESTNDWEWFYSLEGTLVRLYNFENQWNMSTHKKLSAFQSRWSCRLSFGEIFIEYLKEIYPNSEDIYKSFLETLDKNKIYYFLLRTNIYNRVICDISTIEYGKKIIFVGYRNENRDLFLNDENCNILPELEKPKKLLNIHHKNVFDFVENHINPFIHQGIIGFHLKQNKHVKIVNQKYKVLSRIRGNNPNIRLRYLEIRGDENSKSKFIQLYPTFQKVFDNFEDIIQKLAKYIYFCFQERYIKGKYVTLPKEEYIVMRKCFDYSQQNSSIRDEDVLNILNFENPLYIYKMIQRFKMNENNQTFNYRKNDALFFNNLLCITE